MEEKSIMVQIVELCCRIDENAVQIYKMLSGSAPSSELQNFWKEMSSEEQEHVSYWKELVRLAKDDMVPNIFDDPMKVKSDLEAIIPRVKELIQRSGKHPDVHNSFLIAYRMEFFMAYQAYERLYQFLKDVDGKSPIDNYEQHIQKFLFALNDYGSVTPELEILGETLLRTWRENKRLTAQAQRDPLTKLLNRRGFYEIITPITHLAHRTQKLIAVLMLDVDRFKFINDTFGHVKGDEILQLIAKALKDNQRRSDVVARFGGDEFIILLPQAQDPESMRTVGERIIGDIKHNSPTDIPISVSIGISYGLITASPEEEIEKMVVKADNLMYQAKKSTDDKIVLAEM